DRLVWTHFDAGQFLHHDGRMTALMDVEFACLGDSLADLGAMRMRDTAQPIGDLTQAYHHYAQMTGGRVDRHVVNFHAVRFALLTSLLSVGTRSDPVPEFDLAQWESWSLLSQRLCLEIIAEEMGIELETEGDLPIPAPSRRRPWILSSERVLTDVLADLPEQDHLSYRLRIARDLTAATLRADEIALEVEERPHRRRAAARPPAILLARSRSAAGVGDSRNGRGSGGPPAPLPSPPAPTPTDDARSSDA
ncbi:hypothetical protein ACWDUL_36465, partial [Nocardia niigatensis]